MALAVLRPRRCCCSVWRSLTADLHWPAWIGLAAVALHLAWQILSVDLNDPADCLAKFRSNRWIGWLLLCGIVIGNTLLAAGTNCSDANSDPTAFIRAKTAVSAPPLVPEIKLHLATEVTPLWRATEATLDKDNVPPPYWAFAWPGGQALARYILDHPQIVRGRRVLDFAAGSGLVALAAARAGAAHVTASDIDPFAAAAIAMNAGAQQRAGHHLHRRSHRQRHPRPALGLGAGRRCLLRAADGRARDPLAAHPAPWRHRRAARPIPAAPIGRGTGSGSWRAMRVPTLLELEDCTERKTVVWRLTDWGP